MFTIEFTLNLDFTLPMAIRFLLYLTFFMHCLCQSAKAQYVEEKEAKKDTTIYVKSKRGMDDSPSGGGGFDKKKLVPGGNFALSFGNPFFVDISPRLGYLVTEEIMLGLGATYINYKINSYSFNFYGGQAFGRVKVYENIYGNAEMDFLNVPVYYNSGENNRRWLVSPLIGASYVVPFDSRGGIQASVLYNLNYQQAYSPYASPVIWRIGFFL